jgi:hypothetical protein
METEVTQAPNAPEESSSLADHEQDYHPERATEPQTEAPALSESDADDEPSERDATGRFKPRHRAQSQRATAADVSEINALTKRLREAEDAIGHKAERKPGESDRVFNMRRKAELLEFARDRLKAPAATAPAVPPLPQRPAPKPFDEKEPAYEDFANEPDQYLAYTRALAAYDRRKESAEQQETGYKAEREATIKARNEARDKWFQQQMTAHSTRMDAYLKANPDAQAIIDASGVNLTPVMIAAVVTADNSPQLMMRLAQDQELVDDLIILTDGKALNKDLVALVQRRLNRGLQAADTGSATPAPSKPVPAVPRPPNPVRTGPIASGPSVPGDDSSLLDHEKAFSQRRR